MSTPNDRTTSLLDEVWLAYAAPNLSPRERMAAIVGVINGAATALGHKLPMPGDARPRGEYSHSVEGIANIQRHLAALSSAIDQYPRRNPQLLQARKVCAGVNELAHELFVEYQKRDTAEGGAA